MRLWISIAGLMALVAVLAIHFAMIPAFQRIPSLAARMGLFAALPMADVLAVDLAIVVSSLVRRGEVAFSLVTFLCFGGTAILLLIAIVNFAPDLFMMYISITAGLWHRGDRHHAGVCRFGWAQSS